MRKSIQLLSVLVLITTLAGCSGETSVRPTITMPATAISTSIRTLESTEIWETAVSTEIPDPTRLKTKLSRVIQTNPDKSKNYAGYPNLWTNIDKQKIDLFPIDRISDYTYAKDGSLWFAGGFGVIHQFKDGKQDWFSMKNGLQVNDITSIAISPNQEVWVGGVDNSLYRYDGNNWVDEGINFPVQVDSLYGYICTSTAVAGIDFDDRGNIWVVNGGMEIFTKVYGQWMYFPFRKELLPNAGGGGCPIGIRVVSEKDITIKTEGCCDSGPRGYHFDGNQWENDADFSSVNQLFEARHQPSNLQLSKRTIKEISDIKLTFDKETLITYFDDLTMGVDQFNNIWVTSRLWQLLKFENSGFKEFMNQSEIYGSRKDPEPNISDSHFLLSDDEIYLIQDGKKLGYLIDYIYDTFAGKQISKNALLSSIEIDRKDRVWLYLPDEGIYFVDKGKFEKYSNFKEIFYSKNGNLFPLSDGKVFLGGPGSIWSIEKARWEELEIPGETQIIRYITGNSGEILFAATDTGVYKITGDSFTSYDFVKQDENPIVEPADGKLLKPKYTRRYSVYGIAPGVIETGSIPGMHYTARLLKVQPDGSVIYINNKIVAKLTDGSWKSFLFDSIEIKSAEVDKDGNIWLNSNLNGLIKLSPDIFDDYIESEW